MIRQEAIKRSVPIARVLWKVAIVVPDTPEFASYVGFTQTLPASSDAVLPYVLSIENFQKVFGNTALELTHASLCLHKHPALEYVCRLLYTENSETVIPSARGKSGTIFTMLPKAALPQKWHRQPCPKIMEQFAAASMIPTAHLNWRLAIAIPNTPLFTEYLDFTRTVPISNEFIHPRMFPCEEFLKQFGDESVERAHIDLCFFGHPSVRHLFYLVEDPPMARSMSHHS